MSQLRLSRGRAYVTMQPDLAQKIKILAAQHSVFCGDVVAGAVSLLDALTPSRRATLLASFDRREGELVPADKSEADAIVDARVEEHTTQVCIDEMVC